MIKERYKKYAAIIQRAKEEGLHVNDKLSVLMDIESADRKFNIRLDEWLQADLFACEITWKNFCNEEENKLR